VTRRQSDAALVRRFMAVVGSRVPVEATVYLTGEATAVLHGWRPTTDDVDIKVVADDEDSVLRALRPLADEIAMNLEFASPDQFIPVKHGWEDRSPFIERRGRVTFRHFEYPAQALAKVHRLVAHDREDVLAMVERGLVDAAVVWAYYHAIQADLFRYPGVREDRLEVHLREVLGPDPQVTPQQ